MKLKLLSIAIPAALIVFTSGTANAGETIKDGPGAIACVTDKWDVEEPEKGHKLVDYTGRCVNIPDDVAAPKIHRRLLGKYEYMPDESRKGDGTCTYTYKGGDKVNLSWEEGSHLKETRTRTPAARANTGTPVVAVPIPLRTLRTRC